uniref:Uncharacterized protein n=1 Tax=Aegilops tauschii subsp. strangulata TaxID=200361 RepID=A0A453IJ51_AEGTS
YSHDLIELTTAVVVLSGGCTVHGTGKSRAGICRSASGYLPASQFTTVHTY